MMNLGRRKIFPALLIHGWELVHKLIFIEHLHSPWLHEVLRRTLIVLLFIVVVWNRWSLISHFNREDISWVDMLISLILFIRLLILLLNPWSAKRNVRFLSWRDSVLDHSIQFISSLRRLHSALFLRVLMSYEFGLLVEPLFCYLETLDLQGNPTPLFQEYCFSNSV